ncbi:unnamed protein product [Penicillium egyptiacum]|uniref:F-box domain-containing protein n=1 Tax=Penicillium egyptiacum TaxID=1303716 RepID=A0A9W4KD30_9EURO|nr:unnamed protein product [Penicillium egyptiacum]
MSANIDYLSPELVTIVAEHLGCEDLCNFRLSARYLRDCSLTLFSNRFFRARVHLLSRFSLMALLDISRHPLFGLSLQTVVISADHLIPDRLRDDPRSLPCWNWGDNSSSTIDKRGYQKHLDEQNYFRFTGLDTTYLTQILRNARNCRDICLDDQDRPWGAAAIKRDTGLYPSSNSESDYSKIYFKRAVHVVIAAMTASEVPITTLAINNGIERVHVHPNMLAFPVSHLDRVPWVNTIITLGLTLVPSDGVAPRAWSEPLADFIMRFQQLECLDLYFDTRLEQAAFSTLSQNLELPHLRTLKLTGVDCLPEDLSRVFIKHRSTLREIFLEIIGISTSTGGSWQTLLSEVRNRLQLSRLKMTQCDVNGDDICFAEDSFDRSNIIDVIGQDPRLLDRLIKSIMKWTPGCEERVSVLEVV